MAKKPVSKTPLQAAFLRLRQQGLSPKEAHETAKHRMRIQRQRATRMVTYKEQHGQTSGEALESLRHTEEIKRIQILGQAHDQRIGAAEAEEIHKMSHSILPIAYRIMREREGPDSKPPPTEVAQFVRRCETAYMDIRRAEQNPKTTSVAVANRIKQILRNEKFDPRLVEDELRFVRKGDARVPIPEVRDSFTLLQRAISEKNIGQPEVQRKIVRVAFNSIIGFSPIIRDTPQMAIVDLGIRSPMKKLLREQLDRLHEPISREERDLLSKRLGNNTRVSEETRERIIQERRITQLGGLIADAIIRHEIDFLATAKAGEEHLRGSLVHELALSNLEHAKTSHEIVPLLRTSRNRQYLGQLVIEWFDKKPRTG